MSVLLEVRDVCEMCLRANVSLLLLTLALRDFQATVQDTICIF